MATKKIILEFYNQPLVGCGFKFKVYINQVLLNYTNGLSYLDLNYKSGGNNSPFQIGLGADLDETIDNTVAFLTSVYGASSTSGGYLTSVSYLRINNKIEISITSTAPISLMTTWEMISFTSGAVPSTQYIRIHSSTPCEKVYLYNYAALNSVTTGTYLLKNNELGTTKTVLVPSLFDLELQRGFSYTLLSASGIYFSINASIIDSNVTLVIIDNVLTVTISGTAMPLDDFLYSIDGTSFQVGNTFTDVAEGENTLYVKDASGCVKSFNFINTGDSNTNEYPPYTYISESNSLRFIKRMDWGNCNNYKNVYNTLSCEENTKPAYKFIQKYQICDTIRTQVKTSYDNVEVAAGNTEIIAEKIVNNLNLEDKRDCFYFNFNGNLAMVFLTGNIYTYDTDDVIGTYELNGNLPEWGVVGNFVQTDFGTFQISNIQITDAGYRAIIVTSNVIPNDTNENGKCQIAYNRDTYNIWEFAIPMNDFVGTQFNVGVRFYNDTPSELFPDVYWISELIAVKERWERTLEVIWRNSKNTDIYFYSGIEMKMRLEFSDVGTNTDDGSVEIQKTDSSVLTIENKNYNAVEFKCDNITTGIARKLKLAFKHDYLVIENVPYVSSESPEIERLKPSNFYSFTARLLESGDIFNTGTANTQSVITNQELIGLIEGDDTNSYIRIL